MMLTRRARQPSSKYRGFLSQAPRRFRRSGQRVRGDALLELPCAYRRSSRHRCYSTSRALPLISLRARLATHHASTPTAIIFADSIAAGFFDTRVDAFCRLYSAAGQKALLAAFLFRHEHYEAMSEISIAPRAQVGDAGKRGWAGAMMIRA